MPRLTVFMVGTFAAVLRGKNEKNKNYQSVRILLPKTPALAAQFDSNYLIPASVPFIGIRSDLLKNPPKPLLRTSYAFPRMHGDDDEVDVTFYKLEARNPLMITPAGTLPPFSAKFGKVNLRQGPTPADSEYLNWSPCMGEYSPGNEVVHEDYLGSKVAADAAYVEFNFGELSVARIRFDHPFQYIHGSDEFNKPKRPIADTLQLRVDHDDPRVTVAISEDFTFTASSDDLKLVIGSEPISDLADYEPPHPCGEPYFHHELLYRFSNNPPKHSHQFATPVCTKIKKDPKDPRYGGCIPHGLMAEDPDAHAEEKPPRKQAVPGTEQALSLHIGVNELAENFPSPEPIEALKSCVNDAYSMRDLAAKNGFKALDGPDTNVLTDDAATLAHVETTLMRYGQALAAKGIFILTFSGHGYPGDARTGGWCLYSKILPYNNLRTLLSKYFPPKARVMVVCDCCHAATLDTDKRVKQVSIAVAKQVSLFQFRTSNLEKAVGNLDEAAGPTTYFVFACGPDETIDDGDDAKGLSPFTECVETWALRSNTFDEFEENLADCTGKDSHIIREPKDKKWESTGPFRVL